MSIKSFPNNKDEYIGAEPVMHWLHGRTSGVFGGDGNSSVIPSGGSMSVQVSDGIGWISNHQGNGIVWWNDTYQSTGYSLSLYLDSADSYSDRIDRVVVSWKTTDYSELPTIEILKGTPSSFPSPPSLTNNTVLRQISLAQISVPAGTISITADLITDERLDSTVCGIVTNEVGIDTTTMQNQFEALLKSIQDQLADITGGSAYDLKPIRVQNVVIQPSAFTTWSPYYDTEETKLQKMGFKYRAPVTVSGVTTEMTPYVTLSVPDVEDCGATIANEFQCYYGSVYVYADKKPTKAITALTIECRKAVY